MKKAMLLIITILFSLGLCFIGCSQNNAELDAQGTFCRVLCVKDGSIVVWIENIGNVYVEQVDSSLKVEPLDTVVMEFSESDLTAAAGKFTDAFGEEQSYSYVLKAPKSIRHTTEQEPTFG